MKSKLTETLRKIWQPKLSALIKIGRPCQFLLEFNTNEIKMKRTLTEAHERFHSTFFGFWKFEAAQLKFRPLEWEMLWGFEWHGKDVRNMGAASATTGWNIMNSYFGRCSIYWNHFSLYTERSKSTESERFHSTLLASVDFRDLSSDHSNEKCFQICNDVCHRCGKPALRDSRNVGNPENPVCDTCV